MKKLLLTASLLLTFLVVGCGNAETMETRETSKKYDVTPEYAQQMTDWCVNVIKQKKEIMTAVQLDKENCSDFLDNMKKAREIASIVDEAGYAELADVLYDIDLAQAQFRLYLSEDNSKYYTSGVKYLNSAEQRLKNMK